MNNLIPNKSCCYSCGYNRNCRFSNEFVPHYSFIEKFYSKKECSIYTRSEYIYCDFCMNSKYIGYKRKC